MATSGQMDMGQGFVTPQGLTLLPLCQGLVFDHRQMSTQVEHVTCRLCCLALLPALLGQINTVTATLIGLEKIERTSNVLNK